MREAQNRVKDLAGHMDDHQLSVCNGCPIPYSLQTSATAFILELGWGWNYKRQCSMSLPTQPNWTAVLLEIRIGQVL